MKILGPLRPYPHVNSIASTPFVKLPKGLPAIPDSFQRIQAEKRPRFITRSLITLCLFLIHMLTSVMQFCNWIHKKFFGHNCFQKKLYTQLYDISKKGDINEIQSFFARHADFKCTAGFWFCEFLALPELYPHLQEILQGANICLTKDRGFFCSRWKKHPAAYRRISSHRHEKGKCFAIGHILFWIDSEGNTRFQLEKSPLKGFFNSINHIIDYLRYKRDNVQQGIIGISHHTESNYISIVPLKFTNQKE